MTSPNSGQFKKGHDPRRHKFTTEERQRGFWNAIYSIVRRYPDAMRRRQAYGLPFSQQQR